MAIYEYVKLVDVEALRPRIDSARAAALIVAANAQAVVAAPGIASPEFLADEARMEALKHILRGAVLRWDDLAAGSLGVTTQQRTAGPLSETNTQDTRQPGGLSLWPSEERRIQDLAGGPGGGQAFTIDTLPSALYQNHRDVCSVNFGSAFCSCGAILTNWVTPIYEGGAY